MEADETISQIGGGKREREACRWLTPNLGKVNIRREEGWMD